MVCGCNRDPSCIGEEHPSFHDPGHRPGHGGDHGGDDGHGKRQSVPEAPGKEREHCLGDRPGNGDGRLWEHPLPCALCGGDGAHAPVVPHQRAHWPDPQPDGGGDAMRWIGTFTKIWAYAGISAVCAAVLFLFGYIFFEYS